MSIVRLAVSLDAGRNTKTLALAAAAVSLAPAILVAWPYLAGFLRHRARIRYRDLALDSGAFSAHAKGDTLDVGEYIDAVKALRQVDDVRLSEVFALDVIGDWRATERNTRAMWAAGVEAVPTFHMDTELSVLRGLARDYPKVAIGGCARRRGKLRERFIAECFRAVWPKRLHGFGFATRSVVLGFPFESVDASSWSLGPGGYGRWKWCSSRTYGFSATVSSVVADVHWHLRLGAKRRAAGSASSH